MHMEKGPGDEVIFREFVGINDRRGRPQRKTGLICPARMISVWAEQDEQLLPVQSDPPNPQ
jgi:hypothetical protein